MRFDLAMQPIRVKRYTAPQFVDGELVRGSHVIESARGSVQPITPRDGKRLPELYRTTARWRVFCYPETILKVHGAGGSPAGDFVEVLGEWCAVVGAEEYPPIFVGSRLVGVAHIVYFLDAPKGSR